jgi:hypothetical protein
MRSVAVFCLLASVSLTWAQGEKKSDPRPVLVEKYDLPKTTGVGDEFTLTARLKNNHGRVALVSVRLHLSGNVQVLPPHVEQHVFVEPGSPRVVSWKVKRVAPGAMKGFVGSYLVADKRGTGQAIPEADKAALEKEWAGHFTQPGAAFDAKLRLRVLPDGAVEGSFHWTQTKADREDRKRNVGRSGTEFVWGVYDPKTRLLLIDGYRRDDPHAILGLDRYRLTLGTKNQILGGITWANGTNKGRLDLTPIKAD